MTFKSLNVTFSFFLTLCFMSWSASLTEEVGGPFGQRIFTVGLCQSGYVVGGYKCVFVCIYSLSVLMCLHFWTQIECKHTQKQWCRQNTRFSHVRCRECVCVCVRVFHNLLGILVKTHAFLKQHMWWIFIAPRLMSPLATDDEGQDLKNHCFLSGNPQHGRSHALSPSSDFSFYPLCHLQWGTTEGLISFWELQLILLTKITLACFSASLPDCRGRTRLLIVKS